MDNFIIGTSYRQKINFDIFKKYQKFENNAFITLVSKGIISNNILKNEILPLLKNEQKLIISIKKEQISLINKNDKYIFITEHPKNFHQLFNTYIYYHTGYFDPHPRLFHECVFYNKKIIYINKENIKDGGYYRYYDAINNKLKNHSLDINDEIIQKMI